MKVFNRCGLASLEDLESPEALMLTTELEGWQLKLLDCEDEFRSPEYLWPRAPLYHWSRIWEYPFVLAHLLQYQDRTSIAERLSVVDLGSGVTFFPFVIANRGFAVTAIDNDPCGQKDYPKATTALNLPDNTIKFLMEDAARLSLADQSVDIVYCISVLEHLANPTSVITEVHRVLKAHGLFVLTMDLTMDPLARHALSADEYQDIRNTLEELFYPGASEITIHPAVLLTEANSPYRSEPRKSIMRIAASLKQGFRSLLGQQTLDNPSRAVFGYVGISKE